MITQDSVDIIFSYRDFGFLKNWLSKVIDAEKFSCGDINIIFTSDNYLLELNRKFLQHDYYTDVLSFDYSHDNLINGDIFISVDRVKENSGVYNVDYYTELDRVILHGVLHLIGYTDSRPDEKLIMQQKENAYLQIR